MKRAAEPGSPDGEPLVKKCETNQLVSGNQSTESSGNISTSLSTITINDLPQPVLLKIFSYCSVCEILRSVRLVSTSWFNLCRDRDVWRHKKVYSGFMWHRINGSQLKSLLQYATSVHRLQLSFVSLSFFKTIAIYSPYMSYLEFHGTDFHFMRCNDFKSFGQISNLQELILSGVQGITDFKMRILFAYLKKLMRLQLENTFHNCMTGKVFEYLADSAIAIIYLTYTCWDDVVTQEHLLHIARLSDLKAFHMDGSTGVNSEFLRGLAENCSNIERLHLVGDSDEFGDGLEHLANHLGSKLKELAFGEGSRLLVQHLKPLADHCRVLKTLDLACVYGEDYQDILEEDGIQLREEDFSINSLIDALQSSLTDVTFWDSCPPAYEILEARYSHIHFDFNFFMC